MLAERGGGRIIRSFGKRDVVIRPPRNFSYNYVLSILLTVNKSLKNQAGCEHTRGDRENFAVETNRENLTRE